MKSIIKTGKRGIIVILTLCILLGIAGTCLNVAAVSEETTVATDATAVTTEETTIPIEENKVATEETKVSAGETTQELVPLMARTCWGTLDEALNYYIGQNNWSYDANGSPQASGFNIYVSNGYCRVTGDDVSYSFYFG